MMGHYMEGSILDRIIPVILFYEDINQSESAGTPNRSRPAGPPDYYYVIRVRARPRSTACTRETSSAGDIFRLPAAAAATLHLCYLIHIHGCVCGGVGVGRRVSILIIIRIIFERIKCQIFWAFKYPAARLFLYKYV